jgi:hypothetical protein
MIDISRNKKTIFSNPFNWQKLGWGCARYCYYTHLRRMYKLHTAEFEAIRGLELICYDPECTPQSCHKNVIIKFLKNKNVST